MKKLILLLLVVLGGVITVQADNVKIYLKPGSNWSQGNAIFKLYYFNNTDQTQNNWADFNVVDGYNGYYVAEVDNATFDKMIFVRMNPENIDALYWDRRWNQSWNIDIPEANSIYYVADDAWGDANTGNNFSYTSEELNYKVFYSTNKDANAEGNVADMVATDKPYVFTYTFNNQSTTSGYYFMIMSKSNVGESNAISDWNKVYFPEKVAQSDEINNPKVLTFANNQNGNIVNQSWTRWKLDDNAAVKYLVKFDRIGATWSVEPYFERTLNADAEGYATFSSKYDVAVPEGLKASYASAVTAGGGAITWTPFDGAIPHDQGALLEGTVGKTYKFTPAEATEFTAANYLKANLTQQKLEQTSTIGGTTYTHYVLYKDSERAIGFYKVNSNGSWIAAGSAYLEVPNAANEAPAFFAIGGGEGTTDIRAINNEQLTIDNVYYDLSGRRVANPTKGLYIVNGKKVIVK